MIMMLIGKAFLSVRGEGNGSREGADPTDFEFLAFDICS